MTVGQFAIWEMGGARPLVAAALHHGHELRPEIAGLMALDDLQRLHEEDPFTGQWTTIAENRVVALRSRFEVDLNRPRDKAVYRQPVEAWGLTVWHGEPPADVLARSLADYDTFYGRMRRELRALERRFGRFVVFDLHSYNFRRGGPDTVPEDPAANPDVNVGTGSMNNRKWRGVVERFMADLRRFDFPGRQLDVRENVRFQGGFFPSWVHRTFPESGCALAIEVKKFFMDEWTGWPDVAQAEAVGLALGSTVPGVLEELARL